MHFFNCISGYFKKKMHYDSPKQVCTAFLGVLEGCSKCVNFFFILFSLQLATNSVESVSALLNGP